MATTFVNKIATGVLLAVALFLSIPSQADHVHKDPSRKEIRQEARLLKLKGKRLQREGKEMLRESRGMKAESGNRKEIRKKRRDGRYLLKTGRHMEKQGRLLKKGKISPHSASGCKATNHIHIG